jgi:S-adenosyl methyltransferase
VRFLAAEAGIRQFIDIGTGIPSAGNVHEVAGRAAPDTRVVYVDNDRCKLGCAHGVDGYPPNPPASPQSSGVQR